MSSLAWEASALERIPDADRHQLDEILFTPAWDNVVLSRTVQHRDKRLINGNLAIMARLKYSVPPKLEVLPKLFQNSKQVRIRVDVLNRPYLVLYPWYRYCTPPPCVRLMNALLAQTCASPASSNAGAGKQGEPQLCILPPESTVIPPPAVDPAHLAGTTAIHRCRHAVRALAAPQRQRLADALFMQAASMYLFQMHSGLPPAAASAHIFRDRRLEEELRSVGALTDMHAPGTLADGGTRDDHGGPGDALQGWGEDFRSILRLSTVFPLKLQRHHALMPADRPGLAAALLHRWTAGGSVLAFPGASGDRRVSSGLLLPKAVNLTEYSEWPQVPLVERADVQVLCTHPRTLAEAVIQLHASPTSRYFKLQWEGLRPVMLSVPLVQGFAALACCVNDALLQYHMPSGEQTTRV
eukprot:jgi/Ulvmu1/12251/UM086_0044.1